MWPESFERTIKYSWKNGQFYLHAFKKISVSGSQSYTYPIFWDQHEIKQVSAVGFQDKLMIKLLFYLKGLG